MNLSPIPGKALMVAGALAFAGIVAGAVAGSREPVPAAAAIMAKGDVTTEFVQRWDDAPLLKKADRLPLPAQGPVLVRSESVLPQPTKAKVVMVQTDDEEPTIRRHHRERNVCTRHGMRKVSIRGGRSWRCRR